MLFNGFVVGNQPVPMPIATSMMAMMIKTMIAMIMAMMLMASALSQPQSKKCFTNANQMISIIKYAIAVPMNPVM